MLKLIQKSTTIYEVVVESNNNLVGYFIQDVDGYYYFGEYQPNKGGNWSDYVLLELGTKLRELNKPWDDHLSNVFSKNNSK
jgi:hypothetical protein